MLFSQKGTGPDLLMAVLFFITMVLKIFIYYWFSNEILVESQEIPLSIWNSPWYNFDEDIKKSLTLIIVRAQKPLSLMVGPFYQMSTETLVSVITSVIYIITYFGFLLFSVTESFLHLHHSDSASVL